MTDESSSRNSHVTCPVVTRHATGMSPSEILVEGEAKKIPSSERLRCAGSRCSRQSGGGGNAQNIGEQKKKCRDDCVAGPTREAGDTLVSLCQTCSMDATHRSTVAGNPPLSSSKRKLARRRVCRNSSQHATCMVSKLVPSKPSKPARKIQIHQNDPRYPNQPWQRTQHHQAHECGNQLSFLESLPHPRKWNNKNQQNSLSIGMRTNISIQKTIRLHCLSSKAKPTSLLRITAKPKRQNLQQLSFQASSRKPQSCK